MKLFTYKLVLSYDGTQYHGYQKQNFPIITIQSVLENALWKATKQKIKTFAASRTDKGVHAQGQVVHFKIHFYILPITLKLVLNKILLPNIKVNHLTLMPMSFHARYSVQSKIYQYVFAKKPVNPFNCRFQVYFTNIDWQRLSQALPLLQGTHNFTLFTSNKDKKKSLIKSIYDLTLKETKTKYILLFHGKGFLKQMILFLVGFLIRIGQKQKQITDLQKMLQLHDMPKCSFLAPPQGLCLKKIFYKKEKGK
ncbi:tRNA pseudouridine(38-40) synthase TruA [Candidatus Phytoplasma phoenicium]|uniref:tRNA pseudouridine synthase A n=1 Tax=Candidatus Phytoplasma phoenicium TaxID=198422 RepID=A0A0L0MKE8_9MOLU|nr:tRNA pseudouridine(38-40) synthase TruA [Candidatus Phytoplasma phoenicium]KND62761.1 tRNA pseudouridine synthase A [Candidatus Phytoplasma phoenicium]